MAAPVVGGDGNDDTDDDIEAGPAVAEVSSKIDQPRGFVWIASSIGGLNLWLTAAAAAVGVLLLLPPASNGGGGELLPTPPPPPAASPPTGVAMVLSSKIDHPRDLAGVGPSSSLSSTKTDHPRGLFVGDVLAAAEDLPATENDDPAAALLPKMPATGLTLFREAGSRRLFRLVSGEDGLARIRVIGMAHVSIDEAACY